MKNIFKITLFFVFSLTALSSCSNEDDYAIPPYKQVFFSENFETIASGSGSTEIPIAIDGWVNTNVVGSRTWIGKVFSNNKFAEFSSFYSASGSTDDVWLITDKLDFTKTTKETLMFTSINRFYQGAVLKVYVSEDYDGTIPNIATATWTELNPTLPTSAAQNDVKVASGQMDLSTFTGNNVRIAFRYQGSKSTGVTTTFQLDNIKLFENK
ncbi:choice-of-anchor J domain-containing protein [Flavobacterium sp.]